MKNILLLIALLVNTALFSQKKMVLIEGFQGHEIEVNDSLSEAAVLEFFWWAKANRINFESKLLDLKAVRIVPMATMRNHHYHNGVIYIAEYADKYPNIKRALIINEIGAFYGVPNEEAIPLTDYYEQKYTYKRKYYKDIKRIIYKLKTPKS